MGKGGGVNIPSDYTFKLGSDGSTIHIDSDLDNIQINKIAPITSTSTSNLAITQPIVSQSKSDSDLTADIKIEPLTIDSDSKSAIDSKSEIDVKPLVVDSCQTIKLAPLPPINVEQPYSTHFGFTMMGMEIFGFNISGKSEVLLHSPHKPVPCPPQTTFIAPDPVREAARATPAASPSGLRIRVGE